MNNINSEIIKLEKFCKANGIWADCDYIIYPVIVDNEKMHQSHILLNEIESLRHRVWEFVQKYSYSLHSYQSERSEL